MGYEYAYKDGRITQFAIMIWNSTIGVLNGPGSRKFVSCDIDAARTSFSTALRIGSVPGTAFTVASWNLLGTKRAAYAASRFRN